MRLFKGALAFVLMLALLSFPVLVYVNAQALSDWWQLRNYTPPAAVTSLALQDTMTAYSRHIFYVNHPDIEPNVSQFRTDCQVAEQAIVLGCYHSNQEGIFIYSVTDERLTGVEQVTAAHEMLHSAYDRLGSKDKGYVDNLLQSFYKNGLHDKRVADEIDQYKQTEPNDVVNEMHSVFGTEVTNLPASLEAYYARYFTDRHAVTSFAGTYQGEFTSREDQIQTYAGELSQLKSRINSEEVTLQAQLDAIDSDRARLNSERSSGNAGQYNAGVASFNAEVDSYNAGVSRLKQDISTYNQIVTRYNELATELASLEKSIDTRLTTQTAQ